MSFYIDIHALQTLPPNNINRDDTGAPKTATFGGVSRQRVSSQAWKHVIRRDLHEKLSPEKMGVRTKRVVALIAQKVLELDPSWDEELAMTEAEVFLDGAGIKIARQDKKKKASKEEEPEPEESQPGSKYLLFLSNHQIGAAARAIIDGLSEKIASKETKTKSEAKKEAKVILDQDHSVDIALFGRMVADDAAYNVDAAVQVAHAIGVAASEPEFDFYTAVDDMVRDAEETGAGMMGAVEMMSSTLYRYATVNVDGLIANLGNAEAAVKATRAFVEAFILSMPTGKQNTFANRTMPDAVVVSIREDRPVSWVNAFEVPVVPDKERTGGYRLQAAEKMAREAEGIKAMYGDRVKGSWVIALPEITGVLEKLGSSTDFPGLLDNLESTLSESLVGGK